MSKELSLKFLFLKTKDELKRSKKNWSSFYVSILFIQLLTIAPDYLVGDIGELEKHFFTILMSLCSLLLTLSIVIQVISPLDEKGAFLKNLGTTLIQMPRFIFYEFLYGFSFLFGLLLIVPGIYCLIFLALVPYLSILFPDYEGSYFKLSRTLVKKDWSLSFLILFILEFLPNILDIGFRFIGSPFYVYYEWGIVPIKSFYFLFHSILLAFFLVKITDQKS